MNFLQNFFSELFVEVVLATAIAILSFFLRRYVKRQKQRDEEQDRVNAEWRAEFERKLKSRDIRIDYFENQKLVSYKQIRQFAQKARDQARLLENPKLIADYESWSKGVFQSYEKILELLHEHALLLEYYGDYDYLHAFKNVLLRFCLALRKYNPETKDTHDILKNELNELVKNYSALVAHIKFSPDSMTQRDEIFRIIHTNLTRTRSLSREALQNISRVDEVSGKFVLAQEALIDSLHQNSLFLTKIGIYDSIHQYKNTVVQFLSLLNKVLLENDTSTKTIDELNHLLEEIDKLYKTINKEMGDIEKNLISKK